MTDLNTCTGSRDTTVRCFCGEYAVKHCCLKHGAAAVMDHLRSWARLREQGSEHPLAGAQHGV